MSPGFCPDFLTAQGCNVPDCPKRHDVHPCACGVRVPLQCIDEHVKGKRHRNAIGKLGSAQQQEFRAPRVILDESESDQHGISVSHQSTGVDFGIVETEGVSTASITQSLTLTISKTDSEGIIHLASFRFTSSLQQNILGTR
jgi:hypothetical protein